MEVLQRKVWALQQITELLLLRIGSDLSFLQQELRT